MKPNCDGSTLFRNLSSVSDIWFYNKWEIPRRWCWKLVSLFVFLFVESWESCVISQHALETTGKKLSQLAERWCKVVIRVKWSHQCVWSSCVWLDRPFWTNQSGLETSGLIAGASTISVLCVSSSFFLLLFLCLHLFSVSHSLSPRPVWWVGEICADRLPLDFSSFGLFPPVKSQTDSLRRSLWQSDVSQPATTLTRMRLVILYRPPSVNKLNHQNHNTLLDCLWLLPHPSVPTITEILNMIYLNC